MRTLVTLSLLTITLARTAAEPPPNVLFILVDDLGWADVSPNNPNTFYETPHIEGLAASGMNFSRAYAASPVCSPTRLSILTGKHPARTHTTNFFTGERAGRFLPATFENSMALEEFILAEALREAGLATGFFGKWHLGGEGHLPQDQGFDLNIGGGANGLPRSYFRPFQNIDHMPDGPEGEFLTSRLTEEAIRFMAAKAEGRAPFLAYLSFYTVHTPLQAPPPLVKKYEIKAENLDLSQVDQFAVEEPPLHLGDGQPRKVRTTQSHPTYAAMVESMDSAVGQALDALEAAGIAENTIVIFTSDNGGLSTAEGSPTSNLPLRAGKGWLYEGGIRVPLIVRWPGVTTPGSTSDSPVQSTDLYPTLLEMMRLPPRAEQHVDAVSFAPILRADPNHHRGTPLYFHYPHYSNQGGFPGGAIVDGDWKLIEAYEDGAVSLYHLADDPGERQDLAAVQHELATDLQLQLRTWRRAVDARMLRPKDGLTPAVTR
jgi:arylsulfatase A-like enzyme